MPVSTRNESASVSERKQRILDGARRCFVRSGFHAATMQDVATESGMSPGNLYRYFASKEDLVVGLVGRDRERVLKRTVEVCQAEDFPAALEGFLVSLIEENEDIDLSLSLEIGAEARRNPVLAKVLRQFDCETEEAMLQLLHRLQATGAIATSAGPVDVLKLVSTLVQGLCVRRSVEADFDVGREVRRTMAVIRAAMTGTIIF